MSSQSSSNFVRIELAPKPGFCVKSTLLTPGILPAPNQPPQSNANLLEPAPDPTPLPKGLKVFINIAWDSNVPPPPEGSEDAIKRAMQGEDIDENNPSGWYVPMIISNGRQDKDKAGNPSLVFDCVCNTSVKSRTLRDPEFKTFIIELALQRIEEQTRLTLSRTIGTPNILSKGKLLPRTVQIPAALAPSLVGKPPPKDASSSGPHSRPLIQEIDSEENAASPSVVPHHGSSEPQKPKASQSTSKTADAMLPGLRGILKKPSGSNNASKPHISATNGVGSSKVDAIHDDVPLDWSWSKEDSGRLRIDVNVPGLTPALIKSSTLDVEARRIILSIPGRRTLDIDLDISDAEITSRVSNLLSTSALKGQEGRKEAETNRTLQLKRQRDFDVDKTDAEWKVGTGTVSIFV